MPRCPEKQHESPPQECGRGEVVLYINRKARRPCLFRAEVKAKPTCQLSKCFYCVKSVKPSDCFSPEILWFMTHLSTCFLFVCVCLHVKCTHVNLRIWVHVHMCHWRQKSMLGVFLYFFPRVFCVCVLCLHAYLHAWCPWRSEWVSWDWNLRHHVGAGN